MPEAKPRDTNVPRVLLQLVNDSSNLLVPKAKLRNTNNISYYYLYSSNLPIHLLMDDSKVEILNQEIYLVSYSKTQILRDIG